MYAKTHQVVSQLVRLLVELAVGELLLPKPDSNLIGGTLCLFNQQIDKGWPGNSLVSIGERIHSMGEGIDVGTVWHKIYDS